MKLFEQIKQFEKSYHQEPPREKVVAYERVFNDYHKLDKEIDEALAEAKKVKDEKIKSKRAKTKPAKIPSKSHKPAMACIQKKL